MEEENRNCSPEEEDRAAFPEEGGGDLYPEEENEEYRPGEDRGDPGPEDEVEEYPEEDPEEEGEGLSVGTIVKITLGAMFFIAALVCAVLVLTTSRSEEIYTNVTAAGLELRGMTEEEAAEALAARSEELYGDYSLTVRLPDRTVTLPAETLSVTMDAEGAAERAFAAGRSGNVLRNTLDRFLKKNAAPIDLTPPVSYDAEAVEAWAGALAKETGTKPEKSSVNVDSENEKITVRIGKEGQTLDPEALCRAVADAVNGDMPEEIEAGYTYTLSPAVDLSLIYAQVHKDVSDAYYDEKTCKIVDEQIGYGFDLEAANQKLRLASGGDKVVIRMETSYPKVTRADLEQVYFTDVIGSCRTYGLGGYNRATNITKACETLNGVVVAPGATFSYNQTLGERTEEKGYKFAGAYVNGKSVSEVGGGICQVSSTLYNCVLQANLEVVTRSEHIYAAGYVDLGMDATVSWGGPDFQFRNNTEYPIRIEAEVSNGYVNVRLIGTPTGVTVKMTYQVLSTTPYTTVVTEDPEEVNDIGRDGRTVVTYRNVYDTDGNLISSEVEDYSYYQRSDIVILKKDFDEEVKKKIEEENKKKEEEEKKKLEEEEARRAAEEAGKTKKPG